MEYDGLKKLKIQHVMGFKPRAVSQFNYNVCHCLYLAENGSRRLVDIDPPLPPTGEIKLNNGHREVGGNKTSPKKKKKKKQNKRIQVRRCFEVFRLTFLDDSLSCTALCCAL